RSDTEAVENLAGWLTTVVARVSLDMLRSRRARREDYVALPEPIVTIESGPEDEAVLADSVGLALLVVLDMLTPAERLAFVLHDMFGVAFDEIATILDRSEAATRQLASRARRRVRGATPRTDPDLREQRRVVDAFLAAARAGDFEALVKVLDPDVVFRADRGPRGDDASRSHHYLRRVARREPRSHAGCAPPRRSLRLAALAHGRERADELPRPDLPQHLGDGLAAGACAPEKSQPVETRYSSTA